MPELLLKEQIHALNGVADEAQLLNQMKACCMSVGFLITFGSREKLAWIRRACTKNKPNQS